MKTLYILSCLFKYYILIYILWQKSKMNELLRNIHCGYFAHKDFCCFFANVNIEIPLIPLPPPPPPVSHIFSLCFWEKLELEFCRGRRAVSSGVIRNLAKMKRIMMMHIIIIAIEMDSLNFHSYIVFFFFFLEMSQRKDQFLSIRPLIMITISFSFFCFITKSKLYRNFFF